MGGAWCVDSNWNPKRERKGVELIVCPTRELRRMGIVRLFILNPGKPKARTTLYPLAGPLGRDHSTQPPSASNPPP